MKVSRTIRLDRDLSEELDRVCTRHGDVTWHIENALKHYLGSHKTEAKKDASNESKR